MCKGELSMCSHCADSGQETGCTQPRLLEYMDKREDCVTVLCGHKISLYTGRPSGQRTEDCPPRAGARGLSHVRTPPHLRTPPYSDICELSHTCDSTFRGIRIEAVRPANCEVRTACSAASHRPRIIVCFGSSPSRQMRCVRLSYRTVVDENDALTLPYWWI